MKNPRFTSRSPTSLHHVTTSDGPGDDRQVLGQCLTLRQHQLHPLGDPTPKLGLASDLVKNPPNPQGFDVASGEPMGKTRMISLGSFKSLKSRLNFWGKKLHTFGLKTEKLDLRLKKLSISQAMKEKLQSHDADIKIYSHLICRNP